MPEVVQPAYPVPEVRSRTTSAQKFANGVMMGPTQRHDDVLSANPTLKPTRRDPEQRSLAKLLGLYAVMSAAFLAILVLSGATAMSELPSLVLDVLTLQRLPWSAQDIPAAVVAGCLSLGPLIFIDFTLCAWMCRDAGARWFLLHAIGNMVVAALCLPDFSYVAANPPAAIAVSYCRTLPAGGLGCSDWPTSILIAMHVYHMLAFKLSPDDLFHHLLFVPVIGGIHFVYPWGASGNVLAFFISGLPGGIDYFLLAAVKAGRLSSFTEKRINCSINTWLRSPGILSFVFLVLFCWLKPYPGTPPEDIMPGWLFVICFAVIGFNSQYYAQRVIGNYYIKKAQEYSKKGLKNVDLHAS